MELYNQNSPNLDKFAINEPRTALSGNKSFITVKGGNSVTYYGYNATSYSQSQFTWDATVPGKQNICDRIIMTTTPTTFVFTPTVAVPNQLCLQSNLDSLRAYPLESVLQSCRAVLNGYAIDIQSKDIVHILSRFHTPLEYNSTYGSLFPNFLDNYQNYSDGVLSNNNPLATFLDSSDKYQGRGAYTITSLVNTENGATLNVNIHSYFILSPFIWDGNEAPGLTNLDTLRFTMNFSPNLARMWSRSSSHPVALNPIGGISVSFAQPILNVCWITPRLTSPVPRMMVYPYFQVSTYIQQNAVINGNSTLAPNIAGDVNSSIIQFDTVPRKIYLCCRQNENVINSTLNNTIYTPDTFFRINSLNVSWDNINGFFSGASSEQLWQLSVQNGLKMSWNEWNGTTPFLGTITGSSRTIGLSGGVICLECGKDFGLRETLSEGALCKINFKATMNITNVNQTNTLTPDFVIIAVYDGILRIYDNKAETFVGVLNESEVLNMPTRNDISYKALEKIYGGDFFSKFKDFVGNIGQTIKDKQLISKVLGQIPGPVGAIGSTVAQAFGLGQRGGYRAGVLYNGSGCDNCEGCGYESGNCVCVSDRFGMQTPEENPANGSGGRMTDRTEMRDRLRRAKY